jgi:hypothetical protein
MPIINKGTSFSNGEQLTADKINNLLDLATFNQSATDSASTTVNSASQIVVADSGITTAKLATDAVTTAKLATDAVETAKIKDANVTKAKIEDVADYKVLGNVSGAAAAPAEVAILDEDDMVSNSDTALATQQSIKAYVDSISITPVWTEVTSGTVALSFAGNSGEQTYNISDFVLANGAASSTIRSLFVYITASANSNQSIRATYPNGTYYKLASTAGNPGQYAGSVAQMVTIPIAESQSNIKIQTETASAAFTIVAAYVY